MDHERHDQRDEDQPGDVMSADERRIEMEREGERRHGFQCARRIGDDHITNG